MNDEEAFLRAISADPLNDTVRLAYADFLEENPDLRIRCSRCNGVGGCKDCDNGACSAYARDRAELIRTQVELARCPAEILADRRWNDPRYLMPEPWNTLRERNAELLTENCGLRWAINELKPFGWFHPGRMVGSWWWRRGFIEHVSVDGDDWIRAGDQVLERCPLRRVQLKTRPIGWQGTEHVWFEGKPKLDKNRLRLGSAISPYLLGTYWPRILFQLPDWPDQNLHPGEQVFWLEKPGDLRQGDWFLNEDDTYILVIGYAAGGLQTVRCRL